MAVKGLGGRGRRPVGGADGGCAQGVLRLSICAPCILPGARLGAADTRRALGSIRELGGGAAEAHWGLVLGLGGGSHLGGAVLL